jgi:hypothetical protein
MAGKAQTTWVDGKEPVIGDTASGSLLGLKSRGVYTWLACPDCGATRWVSRHQDTKLCMRCAAVRRNLVGEKNPRWRGGVRQDKDGYRYISVDENHPFIVMSGRVFVHGRNRYYIAEHRLVMAQHLRRPLSDNELVHHLNGIKSDNRIDNLMLLECKQDHLPSMNVQRRISDLEKRVALLESENVLLRSQLSLSVHGNPELNGDLQVS